MLANPKRCPECEGAGYRMVSFDGAMGEKDECAKCHGSGVVCGKCGKPDGECGCGGETGERKC